VKALDYCGWCDVNVMYNTVPDCECKADCVVPGRNCVGLNQTKIGASFCCSGSFSTLPSTCPLPPSGSPPTSPPTTIPPLRPTSPVLPPPPTTPPVLYFCNPNSSTCEKNNSGSGGMPLDQCNLTCNTIPDVPVILRGRKFRGLQIQNGYLVGEYTVKFSTTSAVIVDPKNIALNAIVSQTGQYLVLNLDDGAKVYTLWQISPDDVVDFLSWSWGKTNGSPPTSFDDSMIAFGQSSFVFDGCSSLSTVCNFGQ
jgi:hypothetical protein